jgi:glycosyltransferase involved in cell wall biosynthesis
LFLLESFKEFSLNNSTSSFLLIGDTPNEEYFNECKEYIESYGLKDRIEFLGKIDQSEISTLMNKSKVLVLASSYEGLPRVLIEAGLCSLPSLAPNIDGIATPFGKDGGTAVYNLDNSYEFLSNLNKLYNNDKYYSELAIKAYELSNKLSGKYTFANNWLELIKRVMR